MEVELDDSLLTVQPREDLTILALCAFGLSGRHRILPGSRPAWNHWAAGLPADLKDEVLLVWDEGEGRASKGAVSERVTVVPTGPDQFGQVPLRLTPPEALGLLGRPLRVFLENGRNDRGFLLAFADPATHAALLQAERAGWLVFETAGGITELALRAEDAATHPAPREIFRTMYLCDSDALEENAPSREAIAIMNHLAFLAATYYRPAAHFGTVLGRRAAENYAPPDAVLQWAMESFGGGAAQIVQQAKDQSQHVALANDTGHPNSAKRRLLAAVALTDLPKNVRGHLDMKAGRIRHGTPPEPDVVRTIDSVWNNLDVFQKAALLDGFGARFSASFYGRAKGLKDETEEIPGFLARIVERV